jgi:predicted ArsR family transcriptional regulator
VWMSQIRQSILELLSKRGPLALQEIAKAVERSPLATRYHIGLLIDGGLIGESTVEHAGSVGRPQLLYSVAQCAAEQFPKKYDALAGELLAEVTRALGNEATTALLRRMGRRQARLALPIKPNARIETRLNRATRFLCERGYLAHWDASDDQFLLSICNCPYQSVVKTQRRVCEMDVAMIGALMATPPRVADCIADRSARCVFSWRVAGPNKN